MGVFTYLDVRVEDQVENDPLDGRQCRVRPGAKHVGQHVVQLDSCERPGGYSGRLTTFHFQEVGLDDAPVI